MRRSQTGKGAIHGGNGQSFVGFRQRRKVLFLGAIHHLLGSGVGSAEVAVGVPVVAPEEVVLRMVSARVLGSAWSRQICSVSEGTTQACGLLKVLLLVVQCYDCASRTIIFLLYSLSLALWTVRLLFRPGLKVRTLSGILGYRYPKGGVEGCSTSVPNSDK